MKNLYICALICVCTLGYAQSLPSMLVGGGTDYYNVSENALNPVPVTINTGTENKYAGISGTGMIRYEYTDTTIFETKTAFDVKEDFIINNEIDVIFDAPASFALRNELLFKIATGKTLTINYLTANTISGGLLKNMQNYISFDGGKTIFSSPVPAEYTNMFSIKNGTFENQVNITVGFTTLSNATLNMKGDFNCRSILSINAANSVSNINLNGHNLIIGSEKRSIDNITFNGANQTLNVTFGNDADGDGQVIFAVNAMHANNLATAKIVIKDFDYETDLVLFRTALTDSSLLVFEGYESLAIESKLITSGDYNGWTSYFVVIPEPAECAVILGLLTIGLVILKRRK